MPQVIYPSGPHFLTDSEIYISHFTVCTWPFTPKVSFDPQAPARRALHHPFYSGGHRPGEGRLQSPAGGREAAGLSSGPSSARPTRQQPLQQVDTPPPPAARGHTGTSRPSRRPRTGGVAGNPGPHLPTGGLERLSGLLKVTQQVEARAREARLPQGGQNSPPAAHTALSPGPRRGPGLGLHS